MKATKLTCMVCALAALFLMSCNKEKDQTTAKCNFATPEWQSDGDERVFIDFSQYRQYWNRYDEVMVYNFDYRIAANSVFDVYRTNAAAEGQPNASFEGNVGEKKDGFFTFYPANMMGCYDGAEPGFYAENREEITIPHEQTFTTFAKNSKYSTTPFVSTIDPDAVVMYYQPESLETFTFQYLFGMLDFCLKGDDGLVVDHLEIIDNTHDLVGTYSFILPNLNRDRINQWINLVKTDQLYSVEYQHLLVDYVYNYGPGGLSLYVSYPDHSRMLTLNCYPNHPELRTLADVNQAVHLYVGIRPGALDQGFSLKIYFEGDQAVYVTHYQQPNPVKCSKPGVIRTIEPPFLTPENYTGVGQPYSYGEWGTWADVEAM
jgi:hypothetical protein